MNTALWLLLVSLSFFACEPHPSGLTDARVPDPEFVLVEWNPVPMESSPTVWVTSWRPAETMPFAEMCAAGSASETIALSFADQTIPNRTVILAVQSGPGEVCIDPEDGALFDLEWEEGRTYELQAISSSLPSMVLRFYVEISK